MKIEFNHIKQLDYACDAALKTHRDHCDIWSFKTFFFFLLLKLSFNKQYPQFMTAKIIYFDFYMLSYLHNQQN